MKKTSLKAEEALASAVEKYPCLYNKADPGTKRKTDGKMLGLRLKTPSG